MGNTVNILLSPLGTYLYQAHLMGAYLREEDLEDEDGMYVSYRLDGSLFNLQRLQAHTKTHERLIWDLLFADDAALLAQTERALQCITSCFANAVQLFGLKVSLKKTEVVYQPASPGSIPPASLHYWQNRAEVSTAVLLPGLYHLI